jgi:CTP synthase
MSQWHELMERIKNPADEVEIAIVGKYVEFEESYKSLKEALVHAGLAHNLRTLLRWIEAEGVEGANWKEQLRRYDGILVPGGFGKRGIEGMVRAICYAREERVPFFGICLGMQCSVIEFARNVCELVDADSSEFNPATPHRVIYKLRELRGIDDLGGTMRLGAYPCMLTPGSKTQEAYDQLEISERHRHRYEFNREYEETLVAHGLRIVGVSPDNNFVEVVEVENHPWFVGCQFHPEFKSKPLTSHPLFRAFIGAAYAHRKQRSHETTGNSSAVTGLAEKKMI